jgi:hypothetical protein
MGRSWYGSAGKIPVQKDIVKEESIQRENSFPKVFSLDKAAKKG